MSSMLDQGFCVKALADVALVPTLNPKPKSVEPNLRRGRAQTKRSQENVGSISRRPGPNDNYLDSTPKVCKMMAILATYSEFGLYFFYMFVGSRYLLSALPLQAGFPLVQPRAQYYPQPYMPHPK